MPKIGFRSSNCMLTYMDRPTWRNGDTRDVTDEMAEHLCHTFPDNFMPAEEMKKQIRAEKAAAKQAATDDGLSAPAGDPDALAAMGEKGGVDTSGLDEAEAKLYDIAVAKIDKGEELSADEQAVFDKVEAQSAEGDDD